MLPSVKLKCIIFDLDGTLVDSAPDIADALNAALSEAGLPALSEQRIRIPIIMLSAHGDIPMAVDAMKIGAIDFLEKPAEPDVLRRKVAEGLAKDSHQRLDADERDEISGHLDSLTARETEVLRLLVDGKHAKTIATILGTSHNTVRVQRAAIMKKMRADTVADLVRMMNSIGWLDEE